MYGTFTEFLRDETGATAIEYGLIAGLVSVAAVTALTDVGSSLNSLFNTVSTSVDNAVAP
jgi:pilus assembly protein Flp/PilA